MNLTRLARNRGSVAVLTAVLIMTSVVLLFLVGNSFRVYEDSTKAADQAVRLEKLRGTILHLDEVLTMSARMATSTGDISWETRYLQFEPTLDTAIKEAMTLADSSLKGTQTDAANINLVEMEKRAFALVRMGRVDEARSLLYSDEYERQKRIYSDGIQAFDVALSNRITLMQEESRQQVLFNGLALALLIPLLLTSWVVMIRAVRRWEANLSETNRQLNQQAQELGELNRLLDQRVIERTQELETSRVALERSQAFLNATGEMAKVGGWELDADTLEIRWTEETSRIHEVPLGYQPPLEEAINFYHPDDRPMLKASIQKALEHGEPYDMEIRFITAKGKHLWVHTICKPIVVNGRTVKLTGTFQDITEHKQAEETLRDNEERLRAIYDQSNDAIFLLDLDHDRILDFNQAAVTLLGYSPQELLGAPISMAHPHEMDTFRSFARSVRERGGGRTEKLTCLTKSRECIPAEMSASYVEIKGRSYLLALVRDITERKQAEQALRESEERYAMFMGAVNDGIWDWEMATENVYYSPTWKKQLGYEDHEVRNVFEEWASRIHPEDYDRVMASLKNHFDWNRLFEMEYRLRHKGGNYVWIFSRGACIRNEQGRPIRMIGSHSDVTKRRQAEEKVRHTELQLQHSQKMNAIGTLAGGIAHDFNNILAAILGYTQLSLSKASNNDPVKRYLTEILTAGSRAKDLVKQILTFSCQEEGKKKPLHFQIVAQEVLMLIRATLPTTIVIQQELSVSSDLVEADFTQLHQVLMNLCTNAEYAMREKGGVLSVRLETVEDVAAEGLVHDPERFPGPHLLLTVQDTGYGMPPEVLDRIFDPFFTTKGPGEGTGMGMAVVHGIIADHHGRITVTSTLGEGTTVSIVLPLLIAAVADSPDTEKDLSSAAPIKPGQGHVLFVDDEASLVALGKELLEELGYEVTTRTSSLDALEAFRAVPSRYDVVITDQAMPNLSGEALAREILWIRPDIPILLCTGFSHTMTEEKAREVGIRKFLMKPLLRRDLVLAIQELMEEKA